jgi:flagellar assembly factor FliW
MKFFNRQFGDLEFTEEHVILFPDGLIGFEDNTKYLIINDDDSQPFRWLVSLENENLNFPLLDPALIVPDYPASINAAGDRAVFVVAALGDHIEKSSVIYAVPLSSMKQTGMANKLFLMMIHSLCNIILFRYRHR